MELQNLLYNIFLSVISIATPILIGYAVNFIKQHTSAQNLKTAMSIASNSVEYAQQISKALGLDNEAKLNSALASAKQLATNYGVKLTDDQWKALLEPAVSGIKKGLVELKGASDVVAPVEEIKPVEGV